MAIQLNEMDMRRSPGRRVTITSGDSAACAPKSAVPAIVLAIRGGATVMDDVFGDGDLDENG